MIIKELEQAIQKAACRLQILHVAIIRKLAEKSVVKYIALGEPRAVL